jgi:hypothetical protein
MNPTVFAAIGIGSLLTLGLPHRPPAHVSASTAADTTLASKLAGTWSVTRYDSSSKAGKKFTISWAKDTAGAVTGTVKMPNGPSYATRVVWSSDTAFIAESAPHRSAELDEQVVTRMVSHFKGDSLTGTFEQRPMAYKGRSESGRFVASRQG